MSFGRLKLISADRLVGPEEGPEDLENWGRQSTKGDPRAVKG